MIHQYLFTDPYSIWITASRTLQELHPQKKELTGDTLASISKQIIDNTNTFVGNDHYRLNGKIELTARYLEKSKTDHTPALYYGMAAFIQHGGTEGFTGF